MSEMIEDLPKINRFEALEFRGDSSEYFNIWIVNIFLSLITLGIYSAWAKVRTNRYFYANTYLKSSSFKYTADPKKILKGRLILFSLYAIFLFSSEIWLNPIITLAATISLIFISPWIVNRAVKFKLKNTKYRNINFSYNEDITKFYSFFTIHFVLNILTIGLAFPYTLHKFKQLLINNSRYGDSTFLYEADVSGLYGAFFKMLILYFFMIIIPLSITLGVTLGLMKTIQPQIIDIKTIGVIATSLGYLVSAFGMKGLYEAYIKNYVYNHTTMDDENIELQSTLDPNTLAWLYISNIFLIILSLGMLTPWTKIRTHRYKCENIKVKVDNMDKFIAVYSSNPDALAQESEEFFDLDIGL